MKTKKRSENQMEADSQARSILRQKIEHIEMAYLKHLGEGPGHPAFILYDLEDPTAREEVLKTRSSEEIEDFRISAETRGVSPLYLLSMTLVAPYREGGKWWSETPEGSFPIGVHAGGKLTSITWPCPEGTTKALRRRFLVLRADNVQNAYRRQAASAPPGPVVVFIADLSDPLGLEATHAAMGEPWVAGVKERAERMGAVPTLIWSGSSDPSPGSWWEGIPAGRFPVQAISHGGVFFGSLPLPDSLAS
jgi:hypothetical protein